MPRFEYTDFDVGLKTRDELNDIALHNAAVVGVLNDEDAAWRKDPPEELAGNWSARWIGSYLGDNSRTLLLLPNCSRTRELWMTGQVAGLVRRGFTQAQAARFMRIKMQRKLQYAPLVLKALHDPDLLRAYLAHPRKIGPESGRSKWLREHKTLELFKLNGERELELVRLIEALNAIK